MFSPLMTAEFPTYDQAFAYTQAYAIEDGVGLTKKHTNYREKGGPVRNQDLAITGIKARQIKQSFEQQSAPNRPEPTKRVIYNVQGKIGQEMRKG